jgi:T4 RnlA family RNA ligase
MNEYQNTLYTDLMQLVESNEAFYFADHELDHVTYRIFNYRLASYTNFLAPNGLECRGHTFSLDRNGEMVALVALPPEKFFNLNENPMTMDLDLTSIESIMSKADGSLISTFNHLSELRLKSKGSLNSDQAVDSMLWIDKKENEDYKTALRLLATSSYTINMEWCAPHNRIVIGYEHAHLKILNIRNNFSGEYVDIFGDTFFVDKVFDVLRENWIEYEYPDNYVDFVASIPDMTDIEGYVVRLSSGQHIKIKTGWYMALHHTKDSINSPRRLFEAVLESATDDMRSLFVDDVVAINMIDEMEQRVEKIYNHLVDSVERFYERNKDLERKDYAILGQKELDRKYFGLAMSKYLGMDVDYKDFLKRKYKDFGIKDEVKEDA